MKDFWQFFEQIITKTLEIAQKDDKKIDVKIICCHIQ
jgi:hypothetical protein